MASSDQLMGHAIPEFVLILTDRATDLVFLQSATAERKSHILAFLPLRVYLEVNKFFCPF